MNNFFTTPRPPPDQEAILAKCFHPSGSFIEFKKDEVEQSIPERFEKILQQYPCRVAIQSDDYRFTYEQLNRFANQIAHALLDRCEKKEERIALVLESDAPMIAAILGGLKAGKIYVPLDPSLPRARIAYILNDAQAASVITNTRYVSFARELTQNKLPIVNLDDLDPGLSTENPAIFIPPETLTWILYTSGSTGQPKGVVQTHRNVLQFVRNYTNSLHICSGDRLTLLFSCSANGAAHDIFSSLLNGATLHPYNVKGNGPKGMTDWLIRDQITCYCSVPTLYRYFLETVTTGDSFPHLRMIKLVGEPVSKRDVELYQRHFSPDCIFINRLGSTETGSIRWYFIDKHTQIDGNIVPVGYPVEDNDVRLLDDKGGDVQSGEIGEIAVKSQYLTPGYWGKPDLTEAAFLSTSESVRTYRMGDIGRMGPDGCLVCLGRKDSQVKIRGHRVEIAEIEMALLNLGTIKAAVVIAKGQGVDDFRLVTYLIPKDHPAPTVSKLRHALAKTLPEHMIPTTYVFLEQFPLAPNGKLDRKRLPEPTNARPELDSSFVAPTNSTEEQLSKVWAEVLSLDRVGINDNFFELGGHSLTATRITSRVLKLFDVDLTIKSLFDYPTVVQMAGVITRNQAKLRMLPQGELHEEGVDAAGEFTIRRWKNNNDSAPLSFAQQRLWFFDQLEAGNPLYNQSWHFNLTGPLIVEALQRSLDEIVRRHEVLRTKFIAVEGIPEQIVTALDSLPLSFADLGAVPESEREAKAKEIALDESRKSFDLSQGPLIRAGLARMAEHEHLLSITVHHIASDGWSGGILFRELATLYAALLEGKPPPLPALRVQYADFAIWQRQWMQGELFEKHLAYWKTQLAGAPPVLSLPTDHPRPMVQTFRGATEQVELSKELTDELRALIRREGATLFMALLAVFKVLLHRCSGQSDIVVGTDVGNRHRLEIEGLIGFFVNALVLRTHLSGNPTFRELLHRVREVALGAYEHQDLPFEKLVEELRPARSLSHHPLFQVMLVLQNAPAADLELPGLTIRQVQLPVENVVFDLSLQVWETDEGLCCVLKYNTDLFEAGTARRFLKDFEIVLRTVIVRSETRLSSLIEIVAQTGAHSTVRERQELKRKTLETLPFAQRKAVRLSEESKS